MAYDEKLLNTCLEQEKRYTFPSFGRDDVWDLANDLVAAAKEARGPLAVEIDLNGMMVFRYYPAGTGEFNTQWLNRKRRMVHLKEMSSLRVGVELALANETMEESMRLDPADYAACGGGFPIRLEGGCVIGFIGTSGLTDEEDHAALIAGLERYFQRRWPTNP